MGDCLITRRGGGGKSTFPTGLSVTTPPTKTSYKAGESIDLTGIVIMATYSDGSTADVTSECSFSPASGAVVYEDTSKITVSWEWEGTITYTTSQSITVTRVLSSIAITTKPAKTSYIKGETLDLTGMAVTATFSSGTTEVITGYTTSPTSGTALSSLGNVTVTVSYTENGTTKTATFAVAVSVKTVDWASGSDADIVNMVAAADAGALTLSEYWSVGQERTVSLPAMSATNVGESHAAQTVTLVLLNVGGKTLSNGKTCSFVVGLKDCLKETGYMNSSNTNDGSWEGSKRRKWCNNEFKTAMLSTGIGSIFKQHQNITATTYNGTSLTTSTDWFALPAEREIFGEGYGYSGNGYANNTEAACTDIVQFSYYTDSSHRIKKVNGSAGGWWERSPLFNGSRFFCYVLSGGAADRNGASSSYGLAPFGCI